MLHVKGVANKLKLFAEKVRLLPERKPRIRVNLMWLRFCKWQCECPYTKQLFTGPTVQHAYVEWRRWAERMGFISRK